MQRCMVVLRMKAAGEKHEMLSKSPRRIRVNQRNQRFLIYRFIFGCGSAALYQP